MKILFALLISFATMHADTNAWSQQTFQHEEITLPYASYRVGPEDKDVPLVLFLHGAGERGNDNQAQLTHGMNELVAWLKKTKQPCHILAPQCPNGLWWADYDNYKVASETRLEKDQPMVETLLALVESTATENRVDRKRIYLTGLSMGGYGTYGLLARSPETWAAAMPVCGGGDATLVEKFKMVPIQIVHGDIDPVVPVESSRHMAATLKNAGAPAMNYIEMINTGHDSWTATYHNPQFWEWMFAQKK